MNTPATSPARAVVPITDLPLATHLFQSCRRARRSWTGLTAALAIGLMPAGAMAAPTCQDRDGGTIKCGAPGAMPVGWSLPAEQRANQADDEMSPARIAGIVTLIACLFALIALMPPFDSETGWDAQEGDED
jgi:hypothetical protein